ncbi:hypothetical protein AB0A91_20980 [Streptomyces sp. NPDC042207]
MAGRWRTSAAKTRKGMADGLAAVTLAMVKRGDGAPDDETLRLAFRWGIVPANAGEDPPAELKAAYDWVTTTDRPLGDLADPEVFEDVLYRLSYKLDGTPAAGDTYKRRRRALNTVLEHAVVVGELPKNPLQRARRKHVGSNQVVDRRVLVNAVQVQQLLIAVSCVGSWDRCPGRRLAAFYAVLYYAVLYYAGLRPAEAVGLRRSDCHLPETGWGTLSLRETRTVSGEQWTDSGERHDRRGLKARGRPATARCLSRPSWSPSSGPTITRWLNAGVPIAEVARRVGNSPEVTRRRYHGCIDGHEEAANAKISLALEEDGDMT